MTAQAIEILQPSCTTPAFPKRSERKVKMEHWKIVPTSGHTVSLIGVVGTDYVQTSPICYGRPGEIQTENTHYILGSKQPGVWEKHLHMMRPDQTANLKKYGVL